MLPGIRTQLLRMHTHSNQTILTYLWVQHTHRLFPTPTLTEESTRI
jgi:hypothetical protein